MTTFPGSPQLLKGGLILLDPDSGAVERIIVLQYNPESVSRTLTPQGTTGEGDRSEALRLKGPPVETIKLEASIDATDQLEFPTQNATTVELGIQPQLAALETILYPESGKLELNNTLAGSGTLEITPVLAPLTLFVWGRQRTVPVRITEFSVVEEAFDPALNPILAKVSLGLRVLSVNDLDYSSKGGSLFMVYHQSRERMAQLGASGSLGALGLGSAP
jgi:hypothetical protein